jgi:hypothetical protein
MLVRFRILPIIAALTLGFPAIAAACTAQSGVGPQEHSAAVDVSPQRAMVEQAIAEPSADPAEPVAVTAHVEELGLDAFDARRFVGSNHDEIIELIATSLPVTADGETTGSVSAPSIGTESIGTEWALDGLEDR